MSTRPTGLAAHRPHVAGVPCTLAMTGPAAAVRPVVVAGAGGCCGGRQDAGVAARGRGKATLVMAKRQGEARSGLSVP